MTAKLTPTTSSPVSGLALKTSEVCPDVLEEIDRIYSETSNDRMGFTLQCEKRIESPTHYEKQITPGNLLIEIFAPLTEYGFTGTELYTYWVEARPIELSDL